MPFTTFDPATVINCTLSGSNLIATRTGIGGAKALHPKRTGKLYWEMNATTAFSSSNIGILNGTHTDYSQLTGANPSSLSAVVVNSAAGTIIVNGVSTGVSIGGYFTAGGLLCFAQDLDAQRLWVRLGAAGNWNANAVNNPTTGVGGVLVSPLGKGLYVLPAVGLFGASHSCTANFGASAFAGTVPTGYTSGWDDTPDPGPTNELITQIGAETWYSGTPDVQFTQIGVEAWVVPIPPSVVLTQVGAEVWHSVAAAPQGGPMISVIM